jgi:hypothetical protein
MDHGEENDNSEMASPVDTTGRAAGQRHRLTATEPGGENPRLTSQIHTKQAEINYESILCSQVAHRCAGRLLPSGSALVMYRTDGATYRRWQSAGRGP